MWLSVSFALILILATKVGASTSAVGMKGSYSYVGGKSRDLALSIPGGSPTSPILTPSSPTMPGAASSSLAQTSYYEPRGDSYGGGYGGGGGGGGGWGGGGGSAVYHYMHQPVSCKKYSIKTFRFFNLTIFILNLFISIIIIQPQFIMTMVVALTEQRKD